MNLNKQKNPQIFALLGLTFLAGEILLLFFNILSHTNRPVWLSAMTLTILFSLTIVYFTFREIADEKKHADKRETITAGRVEGISDVLKETQMIYREKIRHLESECEKVHQLQNAAHKQHEKTLQDMQTRYDQLAEETNLYKTRPQSLQTSLDDALDELRHVRQELFLIKEKKGEVKTSEEISAQHKQLRDQFEEKSAVLDATRKDLFVLEGQYVTLQKQEELAMYEDDSHIKHLVAQMQEIEEQNQFLEKEISELEMIISKLSAKKTPAKKRKKAEALELQFGEQESEI